MNLTVIKRVWKEGEHICVGAGCVLCMCICGEYYFSLKVIAFFQMSKKFLNKGIIYYLH